VLRRPQEKTVDLAVTDVALRMTVSEGLPLLASRNLILVSKFSSQDQMTSLNIVCLADLDLTLVELFFISYLFNVYCFTQMLLP